MKRNSNDVNQQKFERRETLDDNRKITDERRNIHLFKKKFFFIKVSNGYINFFVNTYFRYLDLILDKVITIF